MKPLKQFNSWMVCWGDKAKWLNCDMKWQLKSFFMTRNIFFVLIFLALRQQQHTTNIHDDDFVELMLTGGWWWTHFSTFEWISSVCRGKKPMKVRCHPPSRTRLSVCDSRKANHREWEKNVCRLLRNFLSRSRLWFHRLPHSFPLQMQQQREQIIFEFHFFLRHTRMRS